MLDILNPNRVMPWGIPRRGPGDALRHIPAGTGWCLEESFYILFLIDELK